MSILIPNSPSGEAQGWFTSKKKSGRGEDTFINNGQGMQAPTATKTPNLRKRKSEPEAVATSSATLISAAPNPPHKKRRGRPRKNLNTTEEVVGAVAKKRGRPKKKLIQTQQVVAAVECETKILHVLRPQSPEDTHTPTRAHQSVSDIDIESTSGTAEHGTMTILPSKSPRSLRLHLEHLQPRRQIPEARMEDGDGDSKAGGSGAGGNDDNRTNWATSESLERYISVRVH